MTIKKYLGESACIKTSEFLKNSVHVVRVRYLFGLSSRYSVPYAAWCATNLKLAAHYCHDCAANLAARINMKQGFASSTLS